MAFTSLWHYPQRQSLTSAQIFSCYSHSHGASDVNGVSAVWIVAELQQGNRKNCTMVKKKRQRSITSWPFMKEINFDNLFALKAAWEINELLLQLKRQEKWTSSVRKSRAYSAYEIWWIDGSGFSRFFLPPCTIQTLWQESNSFPRQKT